MRALRSFEPLENKSHKMTVCPEKDNNRDYVKFPYTFPITVEVSHNNIQPSWMIILLNLTTAWADLHFSLLFAVQLSQPNELILYDCQRNATIPSSIMKMLVLHFSPSQHSESDGFLMFSFWQQFNFNEIVSESECHHTKGSPPLTNHPHTWGSLVNHRPLFGK